MCLLCGLITPQTRQTHLIMKPRQMTSSDAVVRKTIHGINPSKHTFMVDLPHLVTSFQYLSFFQYQKPVVSQGTGGMYGTLRFACQEHRSWLTKGAQTMSIFSSDTLSRPRDHKTRLCNSYVFLISKKFISIILICIKIKSVIILLFLLVLAEDFSSS